VAEPNGVAVVAAICELQETSEALVAAVCMAAALVDAGLA
jgi:hypothetical protein